MRQYTDDNTVAQCYNQRCANYKDSRNLVRSELMIYNLKVVETRLREEVLAHISVSRPVYQGDFILVSKLLVTAGELAATSNPDT